jgi:hypothetical protein
MFEGLSWFALAAAAFIKNFNIAKNLIKHQVSSMNGNIVAGARCAGEVEFLLGLSPRIVDESFERRPVNFLRARGCEMRESSQYRIY